MSAQHQRMAFIAGHSTEVEYITRREPGTNRRHYVRIQAVEIRPGHLEVLCQRYSSVGRYENGRYSPGWTEVGPHIPHTSLFGLRPPGYFLPSQVNLWKLLTEEYRQEIASFVRQHVLAQEPPYELLQPKHLWVREGYEGLLSVPTEDGPLTVLRRICHIGEGLQGVSFALDDPPVCHPLAPAYVKAMNKGHDVIATFGESGSPFWAAPGSLRERFTRVLMNRLVPTGANKPSLIKLPKGARHG